MTLEDRLARARADHRERAWVNRRISEAREERERVAGQLAVAEKARDYEQADVDQLTRGVGGVFRRLLARHADLSVEEQELAAAQLLCDELVDELRAIDFDLAQLATRATQVVGADARYAEVLAELESSARDRGTLRSELDTLAATHAELLASRREVGEAIDAGIAVQGVFREIVDLVRELQPFDQQGTDTGPILGETLWHAITGRTTAVYSELCGAIARAHQGLRRFEYACRDITTMPAAALDLHVALPGVSGFVIRDLLWSTQGTLEGILPEVSRVSSAVAGSVGELHARGAKLDEARAECERMRVRLLDPEHLT